MSRQGVMSGVISSAGPISTGLGSSMQVWVMRLQRSLFLQSLSSRHSYAVHRSVATLQYSYGSAQSSLKIHDVAALRLHEAEHMTVEVMRLRSKRAWREVMARAGQEREWSVPWDIAWDRARA
jgi:hypothetical protein